MQCKDVLQVPKMALHIQDQGQELTSEAQPSTTQAPTNTAAPTSGSKMASAVGGLIAGKLAGLAWDEATLMWTFKDDVDGLKETMENLQALMRYADQMESEAQGPRRGIVKNLVKRFKTAAYDVEDLLDEFETIELIKRGQSKIKLFFSYCNPLLLRFAIAHKIKKVKEALTNIEREGLQTLGMVPQDTSMRSEVMTANQATIAPTPGDIDITMVGRNTEKEKIMELLKSEAEEVISIIPIVGLGGMGKTTLAQSIFSDSRTKTFDVRVWVYVSKKFDLQRIGAVIVSTMSGSTNNDLSERYIQPKDGDLQSIKEVLKTVLPTKKYLIILDDMWEEGADNLEKLKQILQYGGKGSKIVLTTRMQRVVDTLDHALAGQGIIRLVQKSDQINLSILSDDDCWNVMQQTPFSQDEDLGGLEAIGRQIAKKCAGLPLLARSLGFLLSQCKSTEEWEEIRDKKIILGVNEDIQLQDTFERLMLSYYYMPFKFKFCFTYCAVFPKGFVIASDHLIQQWRALGYIQSVEGNHCVNYLLGMCFLQISRISQGAPEDAEAPIKVTMHDLVYDLATIILDQELVALNDSEQMTRNRVDKNSRHMQLINYQQQSIFRKEFLRKIRSSHFTECSRLQLQDKSFSKFMYLRVLDISGCRCSIQGKSVPSNISLPSSIHDLILLRYLDASGFPVTSLPKSLLKLQNMQTLILSNCALETLPANIGSLLNLCYLDLSGNRRLNKLPVSFGELSALWFLNLSACPKLYELPESIGNLISLRHLDMSSCNALQNLPDNFGSLHKLLFLNLSSCSKLVKLPDSVNLKSLEHLNLSSCHQLQSLPHNFGNLDKLKFLNLSDCYKVHVLPESFCRLKHLKHLNLSDCHDLKELPLCFGNLSELQYLHITSCSKLQSLPESFGGLSKLKHLNLSYCIRLKNLPSSFSSLKLQVLYMTFLWDLVGMPRLNTLVYNGREFIDWDLVRYISSHRHLQVRVVKHTVHDVHEVGYGQHSSIVNIGKLAFGRLEVDHLEKVERPEDAERAKLRDNPDLRELSLSWKYADRTGNKRDAEVLENLIPPRNLEEFQLAGYRSTNFPNWMLEISSYLPYLATIKLSNLTCDSLPPLGMLPNLRLLRIEEIPNIMKIGKEFYGEEGACKKLRIIQLRALENLEEWWTTRSAEEEDEFLIPNLHQLFVSECPKLKFLPYPPISMYWDLTDSYEVLPVRGFGRLSSSTLPFSATFNTSSSTAVADEWRRLQHLATLEELIFIGYLPEATPCVPFLRRLHLAYVRQLKILPEWLGQLITLEELIILFSPTLRSLPESIRNLMALKKLLILGCQRLVERCKGEDAHKISHIPEVVFNAKRFVQENLSDKKRDM